MSWPGTKKGIASHGGTQFLGPPLKTQRSGFEWERRSKEMERSFRRQAETERNGFRSDEEVIFNK